ncbi:MAG: M48 family metallopeptidase [Planctomycetota bacterium]
MRACNLLPFLLLLAACQTNPYTGRSQILWTSEDEEIRMGLQAYGDITGKVKIDKSRALNDPLQRVGRAIAAVADRDRARLKKTPYEWEFILIRADKTLNAWALPGGKVAFYTGIHPILQDEAGMAIVMGHEVAHALLRHGGERYTQALIVAGATTAAAYAARNESRERQIAFAAAVGLATEYGFIKPYSRSHETEADKYGLMLAARAGYDPAPAIGVWERMARQGGRPPEILSTHPDPLRRVKNMKRWLPEARALYEQSRQQPNAPLPSIR